MINEHDDPNNPEHESDEEIVIVTCDGCEVGFDPDQAHEGLCNECGRKVAEAALERVRSNWPHFEIAVRGRKMDPGAPGCLRCRIEELITGKDR